MSSKRLFHICLGVLLVMSAPISFAQTDEQRATASSEHGIQLLLPEMDPANGRRLFVSKGCVLCHSVHGVGGKDASSLDWSSMRGAMNPFEFAARMWRGAPAMIAMQGDELGTQILLTGQELADITAFAHDPEEQAKFSEEDIPEDILERLEHDD